MDDIHATRTKVSVQSTEMKVTPRKHCHFDKYSPRTDGNILVRTGSSQARVRAKVSPQMYTRCLSSPAWVASCSNATYSNTWWLSQNNTYLLYQNVVFFLNTLLRCQTDCVVSCRCRCIMKARKSFIFSVRGVRTGTKRGKPRIVFAT